MDVNRSNITLALVCNLLLFLIISLPLFPLQALSAQHQSDLTHRPKVGLVLSGGGARGAAHIGVIRVLEELKIPIDVIAGTSMGAIAGGLYASGMTPDEMERAFTDLDWAGAFQDMTPREDRSFRRKRDDDDFLVKAKPGFSKGKFKFPSGLIQGQQQNLILKSLTVPVADVEDFDKLSIPYRAVATDIATGQAVALGSGDLAMAMRASMSVPGAFAAVEIDGRLLVDGGVSNNLPVNVAREMGADIVIVVDISTPLPPREKIKNVLSITKQLTAIMTRTNAERSLASLSNDDIVIVPDLEGFSTADFSRVREAIAVGVTAAEENAAALKKLSLSDKDYRTHLAERESRKNGPPIINFVRINNQSRLSDEALASRLHVKVGEPLDVKVLERNIADIYGLDLFEVVNYDIVQENGQTGLELEAVQKSWGPDYLQFGIALEGDFAGENSFNIAVGYLRTMMNELGGEWRTILQVGEEPRFFTEFYQSLDVRSRYFLNPRVEFKKLNVNLIRSGKVISEYRISSLSSGLEGGRELGHWGEIRAGWRRSTGDAKVELGSPLLPDIDFDSGDMFLRLSLDKLDNVNFPRSGMSGNLEWSMSKESLGADADFDQAIFKLFGARTWERHTLILGTRFSSTVDGNAPLQNRYRMGGFLNLSGLMQNELSGQHSGLLTAIYYHRINDIHILPAYLGFSLEGGNVWEDKDDIDMDSLMAAGSLFLGVDSFLGPLYLGYGLAEHGQSSFYFFLGRTF